MSVDIVVIRIKIILDHSTLSVKNVITQLIEIKFLMRKDCLNPPKTMPIHNILNIILLQNISRNYLINKNTNVIIQKFLFEMIEKIE